MKTLISLLTLVFLLACNKTSTYTDSVKTNATGKGNGGNGITMSKKQIQNEFAGLKTSIRSTFDALGDLIQAEQIAPGSTDLQRQPQILSILAEMFKKNEQNIDVFADIAGADFQLVDKPCIDQLSKKNAAGAMLLQPLTPICFSLPIIQADSPAGADASVEVQLVGLAAHELVHHFISLGAHDKDEAIAVSVQGFVMEQLQRAQVEEDDVLIIDAPYSFVARYRSQAASQLGFAKARLPSPSVKSGGQP